ncbi:MAG: phosphopentomutase, partial [Clostridiales bacterium]|nr:phosphopentomutase [Clostridiales bacterium]
MKRAILIVLDSVGAGALPDASAFNDAHANTLGHIHELIGLKVPNMRRMGLGYVPGIGMAGDRNAAGAAGRCAERSMGKDTTTGHWEMAGLISERPFPLYPDGFPEDVIRRFEKAIGTKILGNKPASGTTILDELGEEHMRTGFPIVYTSGDS